MSIAERLAMAPELRDTTIWDKPRESDIPKDDLEEYRRRKKAVTAYLNGTTFATIDQDYGYAKSQIYRMMNRCLTVRPNGTMFGFHALIPGVSIAPYMRKSPVNPELAAQAKGLAGAFIQLMAEHEGLYRYVEKHALKAGGKSAAVIAKAIRAEFLKKCAKVRAPNQYPFNTDDQGARALVRFIDRMREDHYATKSGNEEERADLFDQPLTAQPSGAQQLRPFEEAEHDGHNGDFYFVIKTRGRRGEWIYTTPMRLWLLILIDRSSRAILGYAYRLGSTNYPAISVMRSFVHAITPWKPKDLTLPHLAYKEGAGFPSGVAPRARGRLVDLVCFDGAKANTAKVTMRGLTRVMGATINYGRVRYPIARPFIERLNQTLETHGFRRLPMGFNPKGPKEERESALKAASEHAVTTDELEQVIDVMLANYNADSHEDLVNRSPIEYIRMWDSQTVSPLRRVDNPEELAQRFLRLEFIKTIRGGGDSHRTPYIELWWARYTNDVLRKMKDSIGKKVRIIVDVDGDIRLIRGYLRRGSKELPLGILKAGPPWHLTAHTLEQRQAAHRANRIKKLVVKPGTDMMQTFKEVRQREAEERKSATNQLVKAGRIADPDMLNRERDARARVAKKDWIKLK
ncbi:hypothetical protein H4F99_04180 [Lysobacter sp. SG-8]|uniref:Integrase catalytic domain-containing protein n=1 Tax=Marilutibacter penaei TaxID=2759900 RepID=A0A7W3U2D1_9GAMM|nr:hypothetical protein [Lysobacter penaei]MBB1087683.1 hypothetical protein [Lysobacter penaei]